MNYISHHLIIAGLVPAILFVTTKEDARDECLDRGHG
jgi:hypothetical protein